LIVKSIIPHDKPCPGIRRVLSGKLGLNPAGYLQPGLNDTAELSKITASDDVLESYRLNIIFNLKRQ
jgi:hypothetical protein